ncbi:MAG: hypothetical protein GF331_19725 [Chitinivibrionales bacterium]|nr:hypothetical protein [Chitinivibrionales bacterium]
MSNRYFIAPIMLTLALLAGCGIYTFSGSTLPSYMKTVDVPLFANQTLEPGLAESITEAVGRQVLSNNALDKVNSSGDATITGAVRGYTNQEYQYDIEGERDVNVTQYMVRLVVYVEFIDNHKNEALYKGTVEGQGIYDFGTEQEEDGRQRAIEEVVRLIFEKSVQSW